MSVETDSEKGASMHMRIATGLLLFALSIPALAGGTFGPICGVNTYCPQPPCAMLDAQCRPLGPIVGIADTAVRNQLQCHDDEDTVDCVNRVLEDNQRSAEDRLKLINDVKDSAHAQARDALGCEALESDDECAARIANDGISLAGGTVVSTANDATALIFTTERQADAMLRAALKCQDGEADESCAVRVANEAANRTIHEVVTTVDQLVDQAGLAQPYYAVRQQSGVDPVLKRWE